ncbi:hypothetical protein OBP_120 [Pseudomonas phage OBP]|uniref:hypothetical protein n=1 Tax=Pseudomonas phage OBP TaxID=1124849 RepID=UPI000240D4A6|nr:hypothetical protein OBP_120 [Pseudomonas phage OBP]AEV89557.1 hypothetical protein OBP_120 [Pseudomonas phage OBP]
MQTERYIHLRKELVRLYKVLTEQTYTVIIPLSSFLTLKQLEYAKERPPIAGFESLEIPVERPFTIARLLTAVDVMGDELEIGFRFPRKDIPEVYTNIQDWIRYWIEIKRDAGYLRTPSIDELALMERLAKYVFSAYAHYHHEKINKTLNVNTQSEMTLLDILKGKMMFGSDIDEPISFISYVDEWRSSTGYSAQMEESRSYNASMSGFGGGM